MKRARAHYMSVPLAVTLAELRSPLEKSYRHTVYCTAALTQTAGKLTTKWCGQRWCLCCNRMRTARAMNRYTPVVERWAGKQLVTLTVRNVAADQLKPTLQRMVKAFQSCKLGMRRSGTILASGQVMPPAKLVALRKLECTYNAARDDYHPHFHIVTETKTQATALVARWLAMWGTAVDAKAQDVRACDNTTLREAFKYFTKLITKHRGAANAAGTSAPVDPRALDVIFRAMKGQRVYQPVGFRCASETDEESELELDQGTPAVSRLAERIDWQWSQPAADWIDGKTGECLTGYEPAVKFRDFVQRLGAAPALAEPIPRPVTDARSELKDDAQRKVRERLRDYARELQDFERDPVGAQLMAAERARLWQREMANAYDFSREVARIAPAKSPGN